MFEIPSMKLAVLVVGLGTMAHARAQDATLPLPAQFSFSAPAKQDTWNTVLIVSAAVMVVGLIQEESTLTLLGGAGVLVSLVQSNKSGFRPNYTFRGIDFIKDHHVAFGINPFGTFASERTQTTLRPSLYIAANFRF